MTLIRFTPGCGCCQFPYDFYYARDYGDSTPERQLALISYGADGWSRGDWSIASPWPAYFEENGFQREVRQTLAVPSDDGELVYFIEEVIHAEQTPSFQERTVVSCYDAFTRQLLWSKDLLASFPSDRFRVRQWQYAAIVQATTSTLLPSLTFGHGLRLGGPTLNTAGRPNNFWHRSACSASQLFLQEGETSNVQIEFDDTGQITSYPLSGLTPTDWTTGSNAPKPPTSAGLWRFMGGATFAYPRAAAARGYSTNGSAQFIRFWAPSRPEYRIDCNLHIDIGSGEYNPATSIVGNVTTVKAIELPRSVILQVSYTPSPATFNGMNGVAFRLNVEANIEGYDENANGDACYAYNWGLQVDGAGSGLAFGSVSGGDVGIVAGGGLLFAQSSGTPVEVDRVLLPHDYTSYVATRKVATASDGSGTLAERHAIVRSDFPPPFSAPYSSSLIVYDANGNEQWRYTRSGVDGFKIWATSERWLFVYARASVTEKTDIDLTGYTYSQASMENRPGGRPVPPNWDWWLVSWDGQVWIPARAYAGTVWVEEHDDHFADYVELAAVYDESRHADLVCRVTHPNARPLAPLPLHPSP